MLRNRYDNFLGKNYNPQDIYAYSSSNRNRTKMSLKILLSSIYSLPTEYPWESEITINKSDTDILHNYKTHCPM